MVRYSTELGCPGKRVSELQAKYSYSGCCCLGGVHTHNRSSLVEYLMEMTLL